MPRSLFGSNGVVGEIFGQPFDDEPFRAFVRLRNEIDFIAFVVDVKRSRQFFDQDFSGFLSNINGGFEIVLAHWAVPRVFNFTPSKAAACCAYKDHRRQAAPLRNFPRLYAPASSTLPLTARRDLRAEGLGKICRKVGWRKGCREG